jgi:hypothetical protein
MNTARRALPAILLFLMAVPANAGFLRVLTFPALHSKRTVRVVVFPVRHPKRSLRPFRFPFRHPKRVLVHGPTLPPDPWDQRV